MPMVVDPIDGTVDLSLVHSKPPKGATSCWGREASEDVPLTTRKLYVRTSERLLATLEPLRHLVGKRPAQLVLSDEGMPLEAVAHALEWLGLEDAQEQQELQAALPDWSALLGVLSAASWLGLPALHQACEARLRPELGLDNVLRLATVAERCDAAAAGLTRAACPVGVQRPAGLPGPSDGPGHP